MVNGNAAGDQAKKPKKKILLIVGLLLLASLVWYSVIWYVDQANYVTTENAKVSGDILNISSKIPGKVSEVKVETGSTVKKGDVLFTLDQEQLQLQLNQAQAQLDVAKAQLEKAAGGARVEEVSGAQASVDQAESAYNAAVISRDNAKANLKDLQAKYNDVLTKMEGFKNPSTGELDANYSMQQLDQSLAAKKITEAQYTVKAQTIQEMFNAKSQLEAQIAQMQGQIKTLDAQVGTAKGGYEGAKSKLSLVTAGASSRDIAIIEAQVRAAQAAYDLAKLNLANAEVKAPSDGTVVQTNIHVGDNLSPGQAALALSDFGKLQVTAYVVEKDIQRVKSGAKVELALDAFPGQTFEGTVSELGLATASTFALFSAENASGNYTKVSQRIPVKVDFDPAGQQIVPGMSVTAKIAVSK